MVSGRVAVLPRAAHLEAFRGGPSRHNGVVEAANIKFEDHPGLRESNVRSDEMAVDGKWNMTMSTPMGERKATLELKSAGSALTGTQGDDTGAAEIFDGTVSVDDVAWKLSITNPMPLTLAFTGKVSGDSMSGEMGIGPMGSFPFTGTRRQDDA